MVKTVTDEQENIFNCFSLSFLEVIGELCVFQYSTLSVKRGTISDVLILFCCSY